MSYLKVVYECTICGCIMHNRNEMELHICNKVFDSYYCKTTAKTVNNPNDCDCDYCRERRKYKGDTFGVTLNPTQMPDLSPSAETVTNEKGGKQSKLDYRMDLMPPLATLAIAAVLDKGAKKYGDNNWRGISISDHLNHAMVHIMAHISGDEQDLHLDHAACRIMMALECHKGNDGGRKVQYETSK